MKTKLQIIEEIFGPYIADPSTRAEKKEHNQCYYSMPDGRMCAVGKALNPEHPDYLFIVDNNPGATVLAESYGKSLDPVLKEEYRGHGMEFWSDLQDMHDRTKSWNVTGLTEQGEMQFSILKEKYHD